MKKIFSLIFITFISVFLYSCKTKNILESAFDDLENKSYTIIGEMETATSIKHKINGALAYSTVKSDLLIMVGKDEVYTEVEVDNHVEKIYYKINEDFVDSYVYSNITNKWDKTTITLEKYETDSNTFFVDIETENIFEEVDGVWVGNTMLITEMLRPYFEKMSKKLIGDTLNVNLDYVLIDRYNVTFYGENLSKIYFSYKISVSSEETSVSVRAVMTMNFSNIGSTKVIVPEGIE